MKALIEIELEIDGEWVPADRQLLEQAILDNPHYGAWEIDEGRLNIMANSMSIEILE